MRTEVKCDGNGCSKIGKAEEFYVDSDDRDLCPRCHLREEIDYAQQSKADIEIQHQTRIAEIDSRIEDYTNQLASIPV